MNALRRIKSKIKAEIPSIVVSSLEFATWLMEGSELIPQHHLFAVCRPGSALFALCFWTCQFAAGADWAGQGTKWFVMSFTNELTNRFGVGSVDFHGNLAFFRVLEMSREQSRCDNNFSLCRSNGAARKVQPQRPQLLSNAVEPR